MCSVLFLLFSRRDSRDFHGRPPRALESMWPSKASSHKPSASAEVASVKPRAPLATCSRGWV
eukprot:2982761-Amphidinium_carterae.1